MPLALRSPQLARLGWTMDSAFMKLFGGGGGWKGPASSRLMSPNQPIILPKGNPFLYAGSPQMRPSPHGGFSPNPLLGADLVRTPTKFNS